MLILGTHVDIKECIYIVLHIQQMTGLGLKKLHIQGLKKLYLQGLKKLYLQGLRKLDIQGLKKLYIQGLKKLYIQGLKKLYIQGLKKLCIHVSTVFSLCLFIYLFIYSQTDLYLQSWPCIVQAWVKITCALSCCPCISIN